MNKVFKSVYTALFFLVCATPLCLMPFLKNDVDIEKNGMAKMPKYVDGGKLNNDFSGEFEAYFNDRIPLRPEILSAANMIKGELFHSSTSNVIVGEGGWLFYDEEKNDYMDTNAFTDNQVKAFAVTLSLIEENVTSRGGTFVFVPMPNKASIYGDKMPSWYIEADENNLDRIMAALEEYGVSYVDMKAVMTQAREEYDVYQRRDSHWNYRGALIGYRAIMAALGRPCETYDDAAFTRREDWRADLDKLLYPSGGIMDYQYYYDISFRPFMFTRPMGVSDTQAQLEIFMSDREEGDDNIGTRNMALHDGSYLYMVRDSFGRALLPLMIDNYENASFRRTDVPDVVSFPDGGDFVYEIVERNLPRVISRTPFMYAPIRDAFVLDQIPADGGSVETNVSIEGYGVKLYGSLENAIDTGDGRVYLHIVNADDESTVYEAFPIYESELLGGDGTFGFSAIIPKDDLTSGSYHVTVFCGCYAYNGGDITIE